VLTLGCTLYSNPSSVALCAEITLGEHCRHLKWMWVLVTNLESLLFKQQHPFIADA
jgi:hypothetical protein